MRSTHRSADHSKMGNMETDIKRWLKEDGRIFLKGIGLKKAQTVLDFGCGAGHYTIPAAKVVGEEGRVYAVDKDRNVLDKLMQIVKSEGLKNIEPMETSQELKIDLEDESIDVVLLYDVLHYIDKRRRLFDEIHRILKTEALLSVYPKHHRTEMHLELEDVVKEIEEANFYLERKSFEKLVHGDSYEKDCILNFRRK